MAKNISEGFLTFAAIAGAAAAGISYFLQYKSFHKELDEEFHDFEDDFDDFEDTEDNDGTVTRSYVSLTPEKKDETVSPEGEPETAAVAEPETESEIEETSEETSPAAEDISGEAVSEAAEPEKEEPAAASADTTVTVEEVTE